MAAHALRLRPCKHAAPHAPCPPPSAERAPEGSQHELPPGISPPASAPARVRACQTGPSAEKPRRPALERRQARAHAVRRNRSPSRRGGAHRAARAERAESQRLAPLGCRPLRLDRELRPLAPVLPNVPQLALRTLSRCVRRLDQLTTAVHCGGHVLSDTRLGQQRPVAEHLEALGVLGAL
eukprot:1412365-Prymnesium_polylepis.1